MATSRQEPSTDGKGDSRRLPDAAAEIVQDAWMNVLGVYHNAEHEVQRATTRLLEAFGLPQTVGEPGHKLGDELKARIRKNREELERKVDEGVRAAVARVRAPIDKEIAHLKSRVEKLQHKVDERKRARK